MIAIQPELLMRWSDEDYVLDLAPLQGSWTVDQYLRLTDQSNRIIEYVDGTIEVIVMPTRYHQKIVGLLYRLFFAFVEPRGTVLFSPFRLRTAATKFREPDLLLVLDADDPRNQDEHWEGADLVVEVVSPDKLERDTHTKRLEYAQAGIPEYWIVHPNQQQITLLRLDGTHYVEHGIFSRGDLATSVLLPGFAVDVNAVLDAD